MLITHDYLKEQRRMHANKSYGAASKKFASHVAAQIEARNPASILDYGAGKCALRQTLGLVLDGREVKEYDPGVKSIAKLPKGAYSMVVCIDVLEHVEPSCLEDVLDKIRSLTSELAFLTIHTGPAGKFLSDGRNAHLIQRPIGWWVELVGQRFRDVRSEMVNDTTAILICEV